METPDTAMTEPRPRTVELIRRLVGFDTVSHRSNLALIEFVRDYLADLGVDSRLIHDETGKKANLYATLGPTHKSGLMLSGQVVLREPLGHETLTHIRVGSFDFIARGGGDFPSDAEGKALPGIFEETGCPESSLSQ